MCRLCQSDTRFKSCNYYKLLPLRKAEIIVYIGKLHVCGFPRHVDPILDIQRSLKLFISWFFLIFPNLNAFLVSLELHLFGFEFCQMLLGALSSETPSLCPSRKRCIRRYLRKLENFECNKPHLPLSVCVGIHTQGRVWSLLYFFSFILSSFSLVWAPTL